MKCIQDKKTGEIKRVDNKMADNMVGSQWKYISKSEWKTQNGTSENSVVSEKKKKTPKKVS
jgi:hypothetical protein